MSTAGRVGMAIERMMDTITKKWAFPDRRDYTIRSRPSQVPSLSAGKQTNQKENGTRVRKKRPSWRFQYEIRRGFFDLCV